MQNTVTSPRRHRSFTFAAALCLAAPAAFAQAADGSGVNRAEAPAGIGVVGYADAALALAEFGRAQDDPTILVGAARVLQLVGGGPGDGAIGEAGPLGATDKPLQVTDADKPEAGAAQARDLVAELLGEARFLARGDETLLTRIAAVEESATRGSTTGAGTYDLTVDARSYIDIDEAYVGGQLAEVAIQGDGDTDVDLYVYDEHGNLICESIGLSDREYCSWTPAWTGPFTITVENLGGVWNAVTVITN